MDTITHGIVGALIGKAFFADDVPPNAPSWREAPRTADRVAILSATLGAAFPDIDVFAGPLAHNNMAMMTWHRSITHSLVLLPVWAVALAFLTNFLARRLRWPVPSLSTLILIYAAGLASHIFLDVITTFGTMVWSPLDYTRPAWDWVFIIDLILTSAALVPQLAAWAFRRPEGSTQRALVAWAALTGAVFAIGPLVRRLDVPYSTNFALVMAGLFGMFLLLPLRHGTGLRVGRAKWCRVGVAAVAGYLSFAGGMHQNALARMREFANDSRIDAQSIAAMPMPPSPLRWAGMIATPVGVYVVDFDVMSSDRPRFQYFPDPTPNRYLVDARALRDVQTFLWFARFPLFRYFERGDERVVQISDLRFYGVGRPTRSESTRGPGGNFVYQVVFTPDGRLVSSGRVPPNDAN